VILIEDIQMIFITVNTNCTIIASYKKGKGFNMCFNEGIEDRFIRAVVGLGLIVVGGFIIASGFVTTVTPIVTTVVGVVLLGSGTVGLCPLYSILKINTGCTKK